MKNNELKNILDNLNISDIISFKITYKRNYELGEYGYGNEPKHTIVYDKEEA